MTKEQRYRRTKKGMLTAMFIQQKQSSKKRNHTPPTYTKQDLIDWVTQDWLFLLLFDNWVNCGYITKMRPSIDRIDDSKSYSFDNIQITTWYENNQKTNIKRNAEKHFKDFNHLTV